VHHFRTVAFLNSKGSIVLGLPFLSLARFSAPVHDYHWITHAFLSGVGTSSDVELLGHVLSVARLLAMPSLLLVSARCTHRLPLMVLLCLVESSINGLSLGIYFYFRVIDDEIVVVIIRDYVCHHLGLTIARVRSRLLWLALRLLRSACLFLRLFSVSVRAADTLLLVSWVGG
jgi:hypothetical protein